MTGILVFESRHGDIAVEVEELLARGAGQASANSPLISKGSVPLRKGAAEVVGRASVAFEDAMATLRAYARTVEEMVCELELTPAEVSVQVGLKLTGSAGFIIAKAGSQAEMTIVLKWQPPRSTTNDTV